MLSLLALSAFPPALCQTELDTIASAAAEIQQSYVIEAEANETAAELDALAANVSLSAECMPQEEFAQLFTKTLRQTSGDAHFYIEVTREEDVDWLSKWRATGPKTGYGIRRVQVLENNIGYVHIDSFFELEAAFPFYNSAFTMVSETSALILDLRDNHGGSTQTAWPLTWSFLNRNFPLEMVIENRQDGTEKREEAQVLWPRYGSERPVAILVNADTFSAPEAVAYGLQSAGRAIIIGVPTGGGAHMLDDGKELPTGFTLYTPTSRPLSLKTGKNWEGTGVEPDVPAEPQDAISKALEVLTLRLEKPN